MCQYMMDAAISRVLLSLEKSGFGYASGEFAVTPGQIIDILVGISSLSELDLLIKPMLENHYIYYKAYNKYLPNRRLFLKLKNIKDCYLFQQTYDDENFLPHKEINNYRLAHIHVWQYNSPDWIRHIAFRDYLIQFSDIKQEYSELKKRLSLLNWKDGNEYNQAKNDFIKIHEKKAIKWYNSKK
ncbi:MAG: GrpB family protein [Flavobacteriales bacterium]|nr:GrpB family protein [Flavobacteriales bacterium]